MKNRLFIVFLVAIAFLLTSGAIVTGSYFRNGLTVVPGQISDKKLKASRDVENRIATERNRAAAQAKADEMKPITKRDPVATAKIYDNLDAFFVKLAEIRAEYTLQSEAYQHLQTDAGSTPQNPSTDISEIGDMPETEDMPGTADQTETGDVAETGDAAETENTAEPLVSPKDFPAFERLADMPVAFSESQIITLLTASDDYCLALDYAVFATIDVVLDQGVQEVDSWVTMTVRDELNKNTLTEDAVNIGLAITAAYLTPNLEVNEEATQLERERIANQYDVVMLRKDQTIVSDGDPISEEAYAILESLGMLDTGLEGQLLTLAGVLVFIVFVMAVGVWYIAFYRKTMVTRKKESVLLLTLYCIVLVLLWAIGAGSYVYYPILVFYMLTAMLIDLRTSIVLGVCLTIVGYFVVNGSMEYLLFYTTAGMLTSLLTKFTAERNKVFAVGIIAALTNFILSCAISFVLERSNAVNVATDIARTGGFAALNGIFTVIVCMGSLPIWEAVFGVVTPVKLLDLTNPTNVLLRRLTIEAPGTYHHSLIVANLAESAAYDIGANPNTARVGGYYHDIGKLKYPQYFSENITGSNPHDEMDPWASTKVIVSHVEYGLSLASEYRLPQFICDIIREHHGTSLVKYFFHKAKENPEDREVVESDFRYPYNKPQSREAAVIMLADSAEAAVRSMISRVANLQEVERFINDLIWDKLRDGQLEDSKLSIKDISVVAESFIRVLKGMYHERIPYPKLEPEDKDVEPIILAGKPAK